MRSLATTLHTWIHNAHPLGYHWPAFICRGARHEPNCIGHPHCVEPTKPTTDYRLPSIKP